MSVHPNLAKTKEKAERIGVHIIGDGQMLFVPNENLWDVHDAAAKCRFGPQRICSIREQREAVEGILGHNVPQWIFGKNPLSEFSWFLPWVLRARRPPHEIIVAPRAMIRWARRAFDYSSHLKEANRSWHVYLRWLDLIFLPEADPKPEWLLWLFGWAAPKGFFVVPEAILDIRDARGVQAICERASVSRKSYQQWQRGDRTREALKAAIEAASQTGYPTSLDKIPEWHTLPPAVQKSMWKFAKAATIQACCQYLEISDTAYHHALQGAKAVGAKPELEQFLAIGERGPAFKQSGLSGKLFVPSRGMHKFRLAAIASQAKVKVRTPLAFPGILAWALDWVIARQMKGKRRPIAPAPPTVQSATATISRANSDESQSRKRPAREKHEKWKALQVAGLSYAQIVQKHFDQTGEEVSREAVIRGIKRLP